MYVVPYVSDSAIQSYLDSEDCRLGHLGCLDYFYSSAMAANSTNNNSKHTEEDQWISQCSQCFLQESRWGYTGEDQWI
eukprot:1222198-Amphidinium_carterae.1